MSVIEPVTEAIIQHFLDNHDPQIGSPLLTRIPGEIRNTVFAFTFQQYYNEDKMYDHGSYRTSRPGYRAPLVVDTALLQTCRKLYLETRLLPIQQYEHVFWCHRERRGSAFEGSPLLYFQSLPTALLPHVDTIQIFAHMSWLDQGFAREWEGLSLLPLLPRRLKITVRQSDWWNWYDNAPLVMKREWIEGLVHLHKDLCEFVVELEAIERDKDQLLDIARDMRRWSIEISGENHLAPSGEIRCERRKGEQDTIEGVVFNNNFNAWLDYYVCGHHLDNVDEDEIPFFDLVYCVATLVWKARDSIA